MNNVLALQMLSEDVGGNVEMVDENGAVIEETLNGASNDWGHGHGGGGHGHGRSHISLLLCH